MKAYRATVEILLDPVEVGPDALTGFSTPADAADFFSGLLSENSVILDWRYADPTSNHFEVIKVNPNSYKEGDMDRALILDRVST